MIGYICRESLVGYFLKEVQVQKTDKLSMKLVFVNDLLEPIDTYVLVLPYIPEILRSLIKQLNTKIKKSILGETKIAHFFESGYGFVSESNEFCGPLGTFED
jgi:hypothetical protein